MQTAATPVQVGSWDSPGTALRVAVSGTVAYLADGLQGLRLLAVATPANPGALGHLVPPTATASTEAVFVSGNRAYVGSNAGQWPNVTGYLQMVDVANPANPAVLATYTVAGAILDIEVQDQDVLLAVEGSGLHWLHVSGDQVSAVATYAADGALTVAAYPASAVSGLQEWDPLTILLGRKSFGLNILRTQAGAQPTRTPTRTPVCSVTSKVEPAAAASAGCTVSPPSITCQCGSTDPLAFTPKQADGWVFDTWRPQPPHRCPATGTSNVTGVFAPALTLAGSGRKAYCYQDAYHETMTVLRFTMTASEADDWRVSQVTLQSLGDGDDSKVDNIRLDIVGYGSYDAGKYSGDNAAVTVAFSEVTIPAGQTITFLVRYRMKPFDCPAAPKEFGVMVLLHNAQAKTYPPGKPFGSASGSLKLGCVKTQPAFVAYGEGVDVFEKVQQGVDAASGMTVVVCDGHYQENVEVGKALTVRGQYVGERPIVQAANANQDTFRVRSAGVTLIGLDVQGATGQNKAGVYASGGLTLEDMQISGNHLGVQALGAVQISNSMVSGNSSHGVFGATGVTANKLMVGPNGGNGIWSYGSMLLSNVFARGNGGWGATTGTSIVVQGAGDEPLQRQHTRRPLWRLRHHEGQAGGQRQPGTGDRRRHHQDRGAGTGAV